MIIAVLFLLITSVVTLGILFKNHKSLTNEHESLLAEHDELKKKYSLGKNTRELLRKEIHDLKNQQSPTPTMAPARKKRTKKA